MVESFFCIHLMITDHALYDLQLKESFEKVGDVARINQKLTNLQEVTP